MLNMIQELDFGRSSLSTFAVLQTQHLFSTAVSLSSAARISSKKNTRLSSGGVLVGSWGKTPYQSLRYIVKCKF